MSSYIYSLFETSNAKILPLLSIVNGVVSTVSAWSYGRLFSNTNTTLSKIIVLTTLLASLVSLLNVSLLTLNKNEDWKNFIIVVLISCVTDLCGSWEFLPSVVLATQTAMNSNDDNPVVTTDDTTNENQDDNDENHDDFIQDNTKPPTNNDEQTTTTPNNNNNNEIPKQQNTSMMQYGVLISCIDFGDQIASWLTVPLIKALGVSRDNNYDHMDTLIYTAAILSIVPLLFLRLIQK